MKFGGDSLWVHGWGTTPAVWRTLCGTVPSAPDFGGRDSAAGLVDAVVEAGNELGATTVVGWSLGGMLALAAAGRIASLRRCVLIGTGPRFIGGASVWTSRVIQRMQQRFRRDPTAVREAFLGRHLPELPVTEVVDELAVLDAGLNFLATGDVRAEAAALSLTVLWLHGEADGLFACPTEQEVTAWMPRAQVRFRRLSGCGHAPFIDQPTVCRDEMQQFWMADES